FQFPPGTLPHSDNKTQEQVLDKLLAVKQKGDAVVYSDQPKDQFYIATAYDHWEPDLDIFYRVYRDSAKSAMMKDQLFDVLDQKHREEVRQKLLKQLRAQVATVDDKGQFDLDVEQKQDVEKRLSSSRGS
ncbi:MAG TPA: hypothetical protein VGG61_16610, partial [Gemmataceae bacterium]